MRNDWYARGYYVAPMATEYQCRYATGTELCVPVGAFVGRAFGPVVLDWYGVATGTGIPLDRCTSADSAC
jgi:hypothetical protein